GHRERWRKISTGSNVNRLATLVVSHSGHSTRAYGICPPARHWGNNPMRRLNATTLESMIGLRRFMNKRCIMVFAAGAGLAALGFLVFHNSEPSYNGHRL